MRAVVIREPGGPEVLELKEVADPVPSRGEVRIRVRATAVNRADILQRLGRYPAPPGVPPDIPGLEVAGEVDAVGDGVEDLVPGARVFGLVGGGAYAEYVVAHARTLAPIAEQVTFREAAAIPEAFITAWDAMIRQAGLTAGETVLVHAVTSGVGTAALQIANAIGARPIGTTRTAKKLALAGQLGLVDGIVVDRGNFAEAVLARTDGRGVDVVLDLVGGSYVAQDLACVATKGRILSLSTTAGMNAEIDLGLLMRKRAELRGTTLRARPLEEKIVAAIDLKRHVTPLLARGAVRAVIDRVLPLANVADAHRAVQSNATFGKVVLEV
ncbi:MAG TPA: NAD(P)H-quinone oxidoreductase [Polyangiaceae bacterium]|nr:NAD(P)H-quinone oxidoreductase [Polyangiaceae bacterium]